MAVIRIGGRRRGRRAGGPNEEVHRAYL